MRAPYMNDVNHKRKIVTKKDLKREMYACKDCDCECYPLCTYMGGLCTTCMDLNTYTHKLALRSDPGEYGIPPNVEIYDPEITFPHIKIIKTDLDGDCLYSAISKAFKGKITVNDLRYLVAKHQDDVTFATYRELSSFMPEYRLIRPLESLRDFRILVKRSGQDVGVNNCVWGDENALQIISTFMRLGIKVFNEKGDYIQQIMPEETRVYTNTQPTRYVLLLLNSSKPANEHYNLLEFNKHTLLTKREWEKMKQLISQKQSDENRSRSASRTGQRQRR